MSVLFHFSIHNLYSKPLKYAFTQKLLYIYQNYFCYMILNSSFSERWS